MCLYTFINGQRKKIEKISCALPTAIKNIVRVHTFVGGERKMLFPDVGTEVYNQGVAGYYKLLLPAGNYKAVVAGSGGKNGVGGTTDKTAGNGELVESEFSLDYETELEIWVAGKTTGQSNWNGAFGAVNGADGERKYSGSVLSASGGGGGGQSKVYNGGHGISIVANGGGGTFAYSGASLDAKGGNGSGGALGGQSRTSQSGQNAGNGLGGKGGSYINGKSTQPEDGWVKIYVQG